MDKFLPEVDYEHLSSNESKGIEFDQYSKDGDITLPSLTTLLILFLSMQNTYSETDGFGGGGGGGGSAVWKV